MTNSIAQTVVSQATIPGIVCVYQNHNYIMSIPWYKFVVPANEFTIH